MKIPFSPPDLTDAEIEEVASAIKSGWITTGPKTKELEREVAALCHTNKAVCLSSQTSCAEMALRLLGIGEGDEVIVPAYTYTASAEIVCHVGARLIFIDSQPDSLEMDYDAVEKAITDKTKAIMPVSLYGQCADFDAINAIAKKYNLPVVEDGAQSFGATYKGRRSCGLSTIGCTSFFPTKPLGCYGDGGAVFTNDDELAKAMDMIHKHGQDRRYHHVRMGLNSRLDTMQAAVLLAKLTIFEEEVKLRAEVGAKYTELLADAPGIITPYIEPHNTSVYAQYTVRVQNREELQAKLKEAGIPTAVHYPIPLNQQPMFEYLHQGTGSVPVAEKVAKEVMSLPMGAWVEKNIVAKICKALKEL